MLGFLRYWVPRAPSLRSTGIRHIPVQVIVPEESCGFILNYSYWSVSRSRDHSLPIYLSFLLSYELAQLNGRGNSNGKTILITSYLLVEEGGCLAKCF
jgi:hypothetical protein